MSKTAEEMAEEYVEAEFKGNGGNVSRAVCKHDFMSGYKAAIDLIHNNTTKEMSDLANAFAANYFGKEYAVSFDSFLAGYQAAQNQVADVSKVIPRWNSVDIAGDSINQSAIQHALTALEKKPAQQWISVKDRLPEDGQDVLVWYHGSYDVAYLQKAKPIKLQPPQFNNVERFEWCFYDFEDVDVTYWQPLPAPPKEEE